MLRVIGVAAIPLNAGISDSNAILQLLGFGVPATRAIWTFSLELDWKYFQWMAIASLVLGEFQH